MSAVLDAWLRSQSSRCDQCGAHVPTQGHGGPCAPVAPDSEWATFLMALRKAAVDGVVRQAKVRPLIRGRIEPKHIGQQYKRAIREGVLVERAPERSDDELGKNAGRWEPTYELRPAA